METKDVFISYHGGQGNESKSSYSKAEELQTFLEKKGVSCFLYKKTNHDSDFYRAINYALRTCRHLILVACNKEMLSEWVADEVSQFDGLRKNGAKSKNCIISAYIYGKITVQDLYEFNTLFANRNIFYGENGFQKIYESLVAADSNLRTETEPQSVFQPTGTATFDSVSLLFLHNDLKSYASFDDEEYMRHCKLITKRLKCMTTEAIRFDCNDFIYELYLAIKKSKSQNLIRICGQAGTQKSYVLQLLYVYLRRNYADHDFEPVYLHCDGIREKIADQNLSGNTYLEQLFGNVIIPSDRRPLFIIDGILNIVTIDPQLDYDIKRYIDRFGAACNILGINMVFSDNAARLNRSVLSRGKYDINLNLTPISLYDRKKCIDYISTIHDLPYDAEEAYNILNQSGLLTIDEHVIRLVCENYDGKSVNIMDISEQTLLDEFYGDKEAISRCASEIYEFAYGHSDIDFADETIAHAMRLICRETIYLHCLIAINFFNNLDKYDDSKDFSFFNMIFPKEITRFITARIHNIPRYEAILLDLATHYSDLTPMGQSEMSFFLGRIENQNYRAEAIKLLNLNYIETKNHITNRIIDSKYNHKPYPREDYKQDLFLLRGLSVSLIYCGDKAVMKEYIHSLIENDLSNAINRGFHLEYYGDKRYIPNQNTLDYEDNPRIGERTLRILCNAVGTQLKTNRTHSALLLEIFTIVSLLQVRIEIDKKLISFNLVPYITQCIDLVETAIGRLGLDDNIILNFFIMAVEDFCAYLTDGAEKYSPKRSLCNQFLSAVEVKRAGWVLQEIDHPESIVEHMYACWFIGLVYLPEEEPSIRNYDKSKILNMLLIHDLAETKLSDIPKYEKVNYPNYDKQENSVMLSIFLKSTYGEIDTMAPYVDAWNSWYIRDEENAKIAKDIDTIQAIFQFLVYVDKFPDHFDEERRRNWVKEMLTVKTGLGKNILKQLICENERFLPFLKIYNDIIDAI